MNIEGRTIDDVFRDCVARFGARPLLTVPADPARSYDPDGRTLTYADAAEAVDAFAEALATAGYGAGHRIAVLFENRPEMLLVKLACARLGISWVPVNPDYRPAEIAYLLSDSAADLCLAVEGHRELMQAGIGESGRAIALNTLSELTSGNLSAAPRGRSAALDVHAHAESSLLYTSGTTGRPKGCILSHEYELMLGDWYISRGGRLTFDPDGERIYCPLPLFHVNAGILLLFAAMLSGSCQILPERFRRSTWWPEIAATRATAAHYLGVIIPVLMNEPPGPSDREHGLRWALGAGVEPTLHRVWEDRFGFPLVEVWGMTEMCRIIADCHEPRRIDTRAMGKPVPGLEVRVVDQDDRDVPTGEPGEMIVRHSNASPRKGAFSGYLNQPDATEEAWRGGWFHTGDTVRQDETGLLYFVDRKKNIIRRSGENIAAAEIEACLQGHDAVAQVAVIAIEDELRDEEVMACVVAAETADGLADALFDYCYNQLAYYKAPGWIVFVDHLPVTGTQKVLKHMIFEDGQDPRDSARAHDLRDRKRRPETMS